MELQEQIDILNIRISELEHKVTELTKKAVRKHAFEKSEWFDYEKFSAHLSEKGWHPNEIQHYYKSALNYSKANGKRYADWMQAVENWSARNAEVATSQQQSKFDKINRNV